MRKGMLEAAKKVEQGIDILEKRARSSKNVDALVTMNALLYWIRKMTPLFDSRTRPRSTRPPKTVKQPTPTGPWHRRGAGAGGRQRNDKWIWRSRRDRG